MKAPAVYDDKQKQLIARGNFLKITALVMLAIQHVCLPVCVVFFFFVFPAYKVYFPSESIPEIVCLLFKTPFPATSRRENILSVVHIGEETESPRASTHGNAVLRIRYADVTKGATSVSRFGGETRTA